MTLIIDTYKHYHTPTHSGGDVYKRQGGYFLAKRPEDYTVGSILRLTEGSMVPVDCLEYEEHGCQRQESCVAWLLWKKLDDAIKGVIDTVTLADLVAWSHESGQDYSI